DGRPCSRRVIIMAQVIHKVVLSSEQHYGRRLPPRALGVFLEELPAAVRSSVSMVLRNRSAQKGTGPAWLRRGADIRFVDMQGDRESTLYFEATTLGEAAAEFYTQKDMSWAPPDAEDTGFDLLGDVLVDVEAANADSERFDRPLLRRL